MTEALSTVTLTGMLEAIRDLAFWLAMIWITGFALGFGLAQALKLTIPFCIVQFPGRKNDHAD